MQTGKHMKEELTESLFLSVLKIIIIKNWIIV